MEYACPVWFLHTNKNINTLEHVQLRAARWAAGSRWDTSSYCWSKSSDDCLKELNWPSIHQRPTYFLFVNFTIFFIIEIIFPFQIIFICPKFVLSISDLLPQQSTHS